MSTRQVTDEPHAAEAELAAEDRDERITMKIRPPRPGHGPTPRVAPEVDERITIMDTRADRTETRRALDEEAEREERENPDEPEGLPPDGLWDGVPLRALCQGTVTFRVDRLDERGDWQPFTTLTLSEFVEGSRAEWRVNAARSLAALGIGDRLAVASGFARAERYTRIEPSVRAWFCAQATERGVSRADLLLILMGGGGK